MPTPMIAVVTLALTLAASAASAATSTGADTSGIYKCKDRNGVVTFAYEPCPGSLDSDRDSPKAILHVQDTLAAIAKLDRKIAQIRREQRDRELELQHRVGETVDKSEVKSLRAQFAWETGVRQQQIADLSAERARLVEESMDRLGAETEKR